MQHQLTETSKLFNIMFHYLTELAQSGTDPLREYKNIECVLRKIDRFGNPTIKLIYECKHSDQRFNHRYLTVSMETDGHCAIWEMYSWSDFQYKIGRAHV